MSTYSLGGYKIAVLARSKKTIVLEGRVDYLVVQRLLLELAENDASFNVPRVDTPAIVKDSALSGMGNRDRVKSITQAVSCPGKLIGFIDKEWDGFCLSTLIFSDEEIDPPLFATKGHSIENYFFDVDICLDFIRVRYADVADGSLLRLIREKFNAIVSFAFSYSILIARRQLISRSDSLLSIEDLSYDGATFSILESAVEKLRGRGADEAQLARFMEDFIELKNELFSTNHICEQFRRWRSHGHLGEEAIWTCIGKLAEVSGIAPSRAKMIAAGNREDRLRSAAHFLVRNDVRRSPPLDLIVDWAKAL